MRVKPRKTKVAFRPRTQGPTSFPQSVDKVEQKKSRYRSKVNMVSGGDWRLYESVEEDISSTENETETVISMAGLSMAEERVRVPVPSLFLSHPPIKDALVTESTVRQDDVVDQCLPCMTSSDRAPSRLNSHSIPKLERQKHIRFLEGAINNARFTQFDASRPWVVYWSLTGLSLLGKDVEVYRERWCI